MIQEPLIFLGIYVISLILSSFLCNDRAGPFKYIAERLFFIGVIFHESAHYGMSLIMGKIPKNVGIRWWSRMYRNKRSPQGWVEYRDYPSFLQSVVISFAPLYLSTWMIFWLLFGVIFTPFFDPLIKTIALFTILSLLLTAAPSTGDLKMISGSFRKNPKNSWYQIFLISFSILSLWLFISITQITFILDVFYYFAIAGIYLVLKFSIIGIHKMIFRISSHNFIKPQKVKSRQLTRKHHRPVKPWRGKKIKMR